MMGPVFREANPADTPAIIDLFWQVSPSGRTVDYWKWLNERGPFGPAIVEVIELDNHIIGHYAVMPMTLNSGAQDVKAGFAMQVCTHRGHRGLPFLRPMCDRVWKRCAEAGMAVVYGFPNRHIWPIYKRMMQWEEVSKFKSLQYSLAEKGVPFIEAGDDFLVTRETAFPDETDALWDASPLSGGNVITVSRNAAYLNWRFCENPAQHYRILVAWKGSAVAGYAVIKFYHDGKRFVGHVADMLCRSEGHNAVARTLLSSAFDIFAWQQVDVVSCWFSPSHPLRPKFDELGFVEDGFETQLGCRPMMSDQPTGFTNDNDWILTMADSDAF